jgi:hypothetical protein
MADSNSYVDLENLIVISPHEGHPVNSLWDSVEKSCRGTLSEFGKIVLKEGLKPYVKSVVVEYDYICKDHRNLYSHYYSKKFKPGTSECIRLHFFTDESITLSRFRSKPSTFQESYLGYSIIRPVKGPCIGRTVLSPEKLGLGKYCLRTTFPVHIRGETLTVEGFPYTSQDTEATVCAHASLWAVCRYLSRRYTCYGEVYPFHLVTWTGTTNGRRAPYRGMTYEDYSTILTEFGAFPEILVLSRSPTGVHDKKAFEDMCSYIESGFPVLTSITGHVVVAIGHTLNYDKLHHPDIYKHKKIETETFIDASAFWERLVVVDDNTFPYAELGYDKDPNNYRFQMKQSGRAQIADNIQTIRTAVIPLPEKAYLPSRKARILAMGILENNPQYLEAVKQPHPIDPVVTRLFLTTGNAWKEKKVNAWRETGDTASSLTADFRYPHFIWVLQVAPLSLYKDGKCTGEVVLDASAGPYDNALIFARFGNLALANNGNDLTVIKSLNSAQPVWDLYRHNLGSTK